MTTFYMGEGGIVPKAVYTDMNTVLNKKLGTSTAYTPDEWADIVKDFAPLPEKTASGTIATFNDGADTVPLKSLTLTVTPSQSGTGDPSPTNPRPLNSFSSLALEHTGANMLDGARAKDYAIENISTSTSGENTTGKYYTLVAGYPINEVNIFPWLKFNENTAYTFIVKFGKNNNAGSTNLRAVYTNGTYTNISRASTSTDPEETETIVFTSNASKTLLGIFGTYASGVSYIYYEEMGIFEGALTAQDFAPCTPDPHTLDLGSTVYGLTGDVVSGEFEETYKAVKISSLNWTAQSTYSRLYTADLQGLIDPDQLIVCDFAKGILWGSGSWASFPLNIITAATSGNVFFKTTDYTTTEAFLEDWGDYYLCYPLATPTALTIDPVEVESFKGVNNIWCTQDNSSVAVEYRADIELSLQ